MKKKILLLLFATQTLLVGAQGFYPVKKLEQRLENERSENMVMPLTTDVNIPFNDADSVLPTRPTSTPRDPKDPKLAKDYNTLVISIHTKNLQEYTDAYQKFDNTHKELVRLNRFGDTAFKEEVKTLYQSKRLFEESFERHRKADSAFMKDYNALLREFNNQNAEMKNRLEILVKDTTTADPYTLFTHDDQLNNTRKKIRNTINRLTEKETEIRNNQALLYNEVDEQRKRKAESITEANTIPSVLTGVKGINFIPVINIVAQRYVKKENSGVVYGAYLFLASEPSSKDSAAAQEDYRRTAANAIFQPDISKFGFRFNYQRSFIVSDLKKTNENRIELQGQFNYLLKSIPVITTDSTGAKRESGEDVAGFFHFKFGTELFLGNFVSLYGTLNYIHCIQNSGTYKDYFLIKNESGNFAFLNFGITANLAFTNNQNNLRVGLDLVVNNDRTEQLYATKDPFIPFIRVTYIPNLGKTF